MKSTVLEKGLYPQKKYLSHGFGRLRLIDHVLVLTCSICINGDTYMQHKHTKTKC